MGLPEQPWEGRLFPDQFGGAAELLAPNWLYVDLSRLRAFDNSHAFCSNEKRDIVLTVDSPPAPRAEDVLEVCERASVQVVCGVDGDAHLLCSGIHADFSYL